GGGGAVAAVHQLVEGEGAVRARRREERRRSLPAESSLEELLTERGIASDGQRPYVCIGRGRLSFSGNNEPGIDLKLCSEEYFLAPTTEVAEPSLRSNGEENPTEVEEIVG